MRKFTLMAIMALMMLSTNVFAITVDDLVGDYEETTAGYEAITTGEWAALGSGYLLTVTKTGENSVAVYNMQGWGVSFEGTVDLDARTVTFAPAKVWEYYDFAVLNDDGSTAPVVATITDEGKLQISDWALIYGGYKYAYGVTTLTKANVKAEYDADYNVSGWMTGICKVKVLEGYYVIEGLMGLPRKYMFSVAENGELVFVGADYEPSEDYPGYWFYYITSDYDCLGLFTTDGMSSFTGSENAGSITCAYEYYTTYEDENPSRSGNITVSWPADPAGINGVMSEKAADSKAFSLSGKRVNTATYKGIVVKDGKKVRL